MQQSKTPAVQKSPVCILPLSMYVHTDMCRCTDTHRHRYTHTAFMKIKSKETAPKLQLKSNSQSTVSLKLFQKIASVFASGCLCLSGEKQALCRGPLQAFFVHILNSDLKSVKLHLTHCHALGYFACSKHLAMLLPLHNYSAFGLVLSPVQRVHSTV